MTFQFNSKDDVAERLEAVEHHLSTLEQRVDQRDAGQGEQSVQEQVQQLRRAFNALKREQRNLEDEVEESVVSYMEEEREVLALLQEKVKDFGELMREIKQNRDKLHKLDQEVESVVSDRAGEQDVAAVREQLDTVTDHLEERIKKLETRVSILASRD